MDVVIRGRVVTPEAIIEDGWVAVKGGKIHAIGQGEVPDAA